MRNLIISLLYLLFSTSNLFAACGGSSPLLIPASCEEGDIQDCITAASAGDVISVQGGSCTWTTKVTVNKGITLLGNGATIDCLVPSGGTHSGVESLLVSNTTGQARVSGFNFIESGSEYNSPGVIYITATANDWRIDHNTFVGMNSRVITPATIARGLIDNNTITNSGDVNSECAIRVYPSTAQGSASWTTETSLGGADAIYIEDNTFSHSSDVVCGLDIEGGGKVVFRHNDLTNYYPAQHGQEGTVGVLRSEVYENTIEATVSASNDFAISLRGGTGVIYNNTITDTALGRWSKTLITFYYCGVENCQDVTGCHVSEVYGVEACNGYPCNNQPGRTYNQILEPVYIWGNTYNGSANNSLFLFETDSSAAAACEEGVDQYSLITTTMVESRDYYEGDTHPTYTPYTYPHPLRGLNWQARGAKVNGLVR